MPQECIEPPPQDVDGWNQIDYLDAWDSGLSKLQKKTEIPAPYREKFGKAFAAILQKFKASQTEKEIEKILEMVSHITTSSTMTIQAWRKEGTDQGRN